jgi:hypothetical protein
MCSYDLAGSDEMCSCGLRGRIMFVRLVIGGGELLVPKLAHKPVFGWLRRRCLNPFEARCAY